MVRKIRRRVDEEARLISANLMRRVSSAPISPSRRARANLRSADLSRANLTGATAPRNLYEASSTAPFSATP